MKLNIDDVNQLISHIFLNDETVCTTVSTTKEWLEDGVINCEVIFNGIKVDGSVLESTLQHFVKVIEDEFKEKYDTTRLDDIIENKAKELLKQYADNALDKLQDLQRKLEEVDELLIPHWQRDKNNGH